MYSFVALVSVFGSQWLRLASSNAVSKKLDILDHGKPLLPV